MFASLILMSHPYKALPPIPFNTAHGEQPETKTPPNINLELSKLPEPRKHYRNYNSTEQAADDWLHPGQGLKSYLRGYLHVKSADWERNQPHPLENSSAEEYAKMPFYYIMPLKSTMPEAVELLMQGEDENKTKSWQPDEDLDVYVREWTRSGFQGGLNWYKARTTPGMTADMDLFAGRGIQVPTLFLSGLKDWGNHQEPGALARMQQSCPGLLGVVMVDGAGHWPQQEQPKKVAEEILKFVNSIKPEPRN
jgi:pimeloyl-ACP methyl ester carboxylesterase